MAVADFYDALVHDRPYRAALDPEVVLTMIKQRSGTQFDSQVATAMLDMAHDKSRVRKLPLE